jgi:hypothetical protein
MQEKNSNLVCISDFQKYCIEDSLRIEDSISLAGERSVIPDNTEYTYIHTLSFRKTKNPEEVNTEEVLQWKHKCSNMQ